MSEQNAIAVTNPVTDPRIAVIRTVLQNIVATIVTVATAIIAVAALAPQILEALADVLPPEVYAWLAGAVAFLGALAGALAKIMSMPKVNEWLSKFRLGYKPADASLNPPVG